MDHILTPPDPTSCDREPIHTPGSIQPHGLMLVVARDGLRVEHVAGDIERHLGVPAWHGLALSALVGETMAIRIAGIDTAGSGFIG